MPHFQTHFNRLLRPPVQEPFWDGSYALPTDLSPTVPWVWDPDGLPQDLAEVFETDEVAAWASSFIEPKRNAFGEENQPWQEKGCTFFGRLLQISVCIFWCQVSLVFFSCHFLRETFVSGVTSPVNESFNGRPWIGCYRGDSSNAWMLHSTLVGATGIATAWRCKQLADFYRRSVGACRCFPEKLEVLPKMKTDIFVV